MKAYSGRDGINYRSTWNQKLDCDVHTSCTLSFQVSTFATSCQPTLMKVERGRDRKYREEVQEQPGVSHHGDRVGDEADTGAAACGTPVAPHIHVDVTELGERRRGKLRGRG